MRVDHPGPSVRLMPWLSISSQWLLVRSFGPAVKLQPAGNSGAVQAEIPLLSPGYQSVATLARIKIQILEEILTIVVDC